MKTKLVDNIYIEKEELNLKKMFQEFIEGKDISGNILGEVLEKSLLTITEMLKKSRWVKMEDDLIYDNRVIGCWKGLDSDFQYKNFNSGRNISEINLEEYKYKEINADLPILRELKKSLIGINVAPFKIIYSSLNKSFCNLYKTNGKIQGFNCANYSLQNYISGNMIPFYRLAGENSKILKERKVMFLWIKNKLIPKELKSDAAYNSLLNFDFEVENFFEIKKVSIQNDSIEGVDLSKNILFEDKVRADIKEYNDKILDDTEQGHWSLWSDENWYKEPMKIKLSKKMVARNPASSIVDGVVGIDFGTKSTVVIYQENTVKSYPMRIGTGDLSKGIESYHYENPTIMEFNNLKNFFSDYSDRDGRPYTEWKDLTVSHTAFNSLMGSKTDDFNSYISELKQWAGNKNKKLKIVDKKSYIADIPAFIELEEHHINPIEFYAYYLGLYINNQHNGIFMNYILSFPVTYELEIRDKIIDSFYKGIKKSLPQELHYQPEYLEKLSVIKGASEPAAYAVTALQEYGFDPEEEEEVFYGIFDFGGGTTDFDFGIWRESKGGKEKRYDYVIEHFGAGGDKYLGGENLLELLAFEIFKKNKEKLLTESIQFILPPECSKFLGSEILLSQSREAKMNMKTLIETLRPFWERKEGDKNDFENGEIGVNLTDVKGTNHANYNLDIDIDEMTGILRNRIHKGVKNFFESLRMAFNNQKVNLTDVEKINIFLAGNSSKSELVSELFLEEIGKVTEDIMKNNVDIKSDSIFEMFPPLGTKEADKKFEERGLEIKTDLGRPTGKTGVAFGLIDTRKGGDILVVDHNVNEDKINFKYYLGESRKKKFKVLVKREEKYNKWIEFVDAYEDTFELYYTTQPLASTNKLSITDSSIKKVIVNIDKVDDEAFVYIRITKSTEIEYVVAYKDEINNNNYLGEIKTIILD